MNDFPFQRRACFDFAKRIVHNVNRSGQQLVPLLTVTHKIAIECLKKSLYIFFEYNKKEKEKKKSRDVSEYFIEIFL